MKINLGLIWTMITSTVIAVAYMFTNFVSASDFNDLNHTFIKREIREIRKDIREETDPDIIEYLEEDLEELIDNLCRIAPDDRECE